MHYGHVLLVALRNVLEVRPAVFPLTISHPRGLHSLEQSPRDQPQEIRFFFEARLSPLAIAAETRLPLCELCRAQLPDC